MTSFRGSERWSRRRVVSSATALLLAATWPLAAPLGAQLAQPTVTARALAPLRGLAAIVRLAADSAPAVRRMMASADAARGGLLIGKAAFAPAVVLGVGQRRAPTLDPDPDANALPATTMTSTYDMTATTLLRSGITVQPTIHVIQSRLSTTDPYSATVGTTLSVPLARNRFGSATRESERAAQELLDAARLDVANTRATSARDAALAYWSLWSAERSVVVYRDAETRAERSLANLRMLVAAGERARTDLNQVEATAASRRSSRLAAEQSVLSARRTLAGVLGWTAVEIQTVDVAETTAPEPAPYSLTADDVQALVAHALQHRDDLRSTARAVAAAAASASAARSDARTQLDVVGGLSVSGVGARGIGSLAQTAASRLAGTGATATIGLQYALPASSIGRQGVELEAHAAAEDAAVQHTALGRSIELAVGVAADAVRRSADVLAQSRTAAALYRTGVDDEQRKYASEANTIFEVLVAEDRLTSAELDRVARETAYAQAVINLRYETGMLLDVVTGDADAAALMRPPRPSPSENARPAREDR